jgi:HD-like signal output (HDOD) protein
MSENLAEQVIRPSYEQIMGSIRHSGVQEILRRAQEVEDEITEQRSILTTLAVTEGDESFEPLLLLQLGHYVLSHIAQCFIHLLGGSLQSTHPRVHSRFSPFSRLKSAAGVPIH